MAGPKARMIMKKPRKLPKQIDGGPDEAVAEFAAKFVSEVRGTDAKPEADKTEKAEAVKVKNDPASNPAIKVHTTKRIDETLAKYKKKYRSKKTNPERKGNVHAESQADGRTGGRDRAVAGNTRGADGLRKPGGFRFPVDWFRSE